MINPTIPPLDGVTHDINEAAQIRTVSEGVTARLNQTLKNVDSIVCASIGDPDKQMGVLIMAVVLATRRFLDSNGVTDRGRRMRLIKEAVRQFDSKLRTYVAQKP